METVLDPFQFGVICVCVAVLLGLFIKEALRPIKIGTMAYSPADKTAIVQTVLFIGQPVFTPSLCEGCMANTGAIRDAMRNTLKSNIKALAMSVVTGRAMPALVFQLDAKTTSRGCSDPETCRAKVTALRVAYTRFARGTTRREIADVANELDIGRLVVHAMTLIPLIE
jgi:hypothetical protein